MSTIELTLAGLAFGGEAFGRDAAGRMIFVPYALPGERVRAQLVEEHKRWARGKLLEILETSATRIAPRCGHYMRCGGCHYQHLPYTDQVEAKRLIVQEQFQRIGGFEHPPVKAAIASASPWSYRNNVQFSITDDRKLGFVTSDSAKVFTVEECHLPEQPLSTLWPCIDLEGLPEIERLSIRCGSSREPLIVLHGQGYPQAELVIDLRASVVWLSPEGAFVLAGDLLLEQVVMGRSFRLSPGSFFQVNSSLNDELVRRALEALGPRKGELIYDLYAGVGLFSASIAEAGASVRAVEESPWACADFEVNLSEFEDVALYESTVELALPVLDKHPDAVLVDPPRAGLSRPVLEGLTEIAPARIVYVSCDPATLARDGKRLATAGYSLQWVTPIDMFPQTYHIETLSLWLR